MFTRRLLALAAASVLSVSARAAAPTYSTSGSGSVSGFTTTETGTGTNIWDVALTATGSTTSPYFTVTISGSGSPVIRNLNVVSVDAEPPTQLAGNVVKVSIASSIVRIENIHQTDGTGELWCELIRPLEEI